MSRLGRHWKLAAAVLTVVGSGYWYVDSNQEEWAAEAAADAAKDAERQAVVEDMRSQTIGALGLEPVFLEANFKSMDEGVYKIKTQIDGATVTCLLNVDSPKGHSYREVTIEYCR